MRKLISYLLLSNIKMKTNHHSNIPFISASKYKNWNYQIYFYSRSNKNRNKMFILISIPAYQTWSEFNLWDSALCSELSLLSLVSFPPYLSKQQADWLDMPHTSDLHFPTLLSVLQFSCPAPTEEKYKRHGIS